MADEKPLSPDEIENIVNERKKEAAALKLTEFAHDLYRRIHCWPKSFTDPRWQWAKPAPFIVSAEERRDGNSTIVEIRTADNGFVSIKTAQTDSDSHGNFSSETYDLSIVVANKIVFTTSLTETCEMLPPDDARTNSYTSGVKAYIPGPWVSELKTLLARMETAEKEQADNLMKKHKEDPARLGDLKDKFGI